MKQFFFISIVLLYSFSVSYSQGFTIEEAMNYSFPENLVASPSMARVAWTENHQGKRSIFVAEGPRFSGKSQVSFLEDDGQALGELTFSPDGNYIAYVRGGGGNRQGEIPNPTSEIEPAKREIYLLPFVGRGADLIAEGSNPSFSPDGKWLSFLRGGQVWAKELNTDKNPSRLFSIRGSASSPQWSPDGSKLAFVSSRGTHSYVGIFDLATKKIEYISPSVDQDRNPIWSPNGNKIAFTRTPQQSGLLPFVERREGLPWTIMVHDLANNETKEIWKANKGNGSFFWSISADNQLFWSADDQIVFPWEGDGWLHLYAINSAGGNARLLTPGKFEVQYVTMTPDRKAMVYSSNQDDIDRQHIWKVDVANGTPQAITKGTGLEWSPVVNSDGDIAMLVAGPRQPAFASFVNDEGMPEPLRPGIFPNDYPTKAMVEPEQIVFKAEDGLDIHAQLFKPANYNPNQEYPALLFFHGGSRRQMYLGFHDRGYYHNAYAMNQYLASQGYLVMAVNYRSGIGYGMEFREALNYGANGASEYKDVLAAGKLLQQRKDVDNKRIGLWGGSYGGYLTAMGLAQNSDIFAAGVDFHGVHNWNVVIRNFRSDYNPQQEAEVAKKAFESSPMNFIAGWKSPVLVIHADDDRNVPFSETVDLVEALRKRDVYFEQLIYPDDVHGFLLHRNWVNAYKATADFFDRFLKNKE